MKKSLLALAAPLFTHLAIGATLDVDSNANPGLFPVPGGTWDFNHTILWSPDGGETRLPWTSNEDVARITLPGKSAWGSVTLSLDNSLGPVGASAIEIQGELPDWNHVVFTNDTLTVGSGGYRDYSTNPNSFTYFRCPVTLQGSQTWFTHTKRAMSGCGTICVESPLTSDADTTLTLDGCGMVDPSVATLSNTYRPGFKFAASNALAGPVVVRNGAMLWLSYSASDLGSRFSTTAPLILEGGSVWMVGQNLTVTQVIPSVLVRKGFNILRGNNITGYYRLGSVTRDGLGGTLDFPIGWSGGTVSYLEGPVNAFLGGWATLSTSMWAVFKNDGTVSGHSGTQRAPSNLTNGINAQINAGGSCTTDVAPNTLRFVTPDPVDLTTATITIQSGGLMSYQQPLTLQNGTIRTGMETGELFVHANTAISMSSTLADNGEVPGALVKGGPAALTLSGTFGFTGTTFLNGGSLRFTDSATLSTPIEQAGGTTLAAANGGTLAPPAEGWDLDGNLRLDDGAILALPLVLDAPAPIRLTNRFATLAQPEGAAITLRLSWPEDVEPRRAAFPLLSWDPEAATPTLNLEAISLELPEFFNAELTIADNTLVCTVTEIPPTGTILFIR